MNVAESQIEAVFFAALEKGSPGERAAFLENACAGDAELRKRVEQLLGAQPQLGDFLVSPTFDDPLAVPPFAEAIGSMIGPYKLREVLGEGGMGTVYVAEQQSPIRRKVALKLIKPGMDTREVVMRFEAERQALALMDHPHIAKVLDVGATPSGRPYFVMELIPGVPITDYCDERELSPRERLALFIRVCQGMQHAHEKGIVHRDLKPSNLLVTQHDGIPHPKVIDFGVAKAVEQKLTENTIYTRFAQVIGTPLYMSPEQAQLDGADVDPRSDVYSLGVVLYELLTGTTPFDGETLKKAGFDGMRKIIREEEPPRPSSRMSTLDARRRSTITLRRGTDPGRLMRLLRGDLDWIVMKALDKDRNRRYPSAGAFAADIQRFLDDKPVEARPPSLAYRMRKFVHRHWRLLSAAALVAVCAPPAIYGLRVQFIGIPMSTPRPQTAQSARPELNLLSQENTSTYAAPESPVSSGTPPLPFLPSLGPILPGLVSEPAYPAGVRKWQLTTSAPRGVLTSGVRNPDETRIAVGEANNVRIYDAATMTLLNVLVGHTEPITSVAWHPSGDVLASASRDGTIRLWSSVGIPAPVLKGHAGVVHQVAWRPDGSRLASCSADGTVRIWNADASLDRVIEEADRHVFCIGWSPDGTLLASGGGDIRPPIPGGAHGDNRIRVWDVDTGKMVQAIGGSERHSVLALDWRPDGEQLAAGYGEVYRSTQEAYVPIRDAGLRLWNKDGTAAPGIKEEVGSISAVAWDAEGQRLAFAGRHPELRILNTRTGAVATSPKEYALDVISLQWTKDSSRVLVTNRAMLREWDGRQLLQHLLQGLASEGFYYVRWSPDGATIAGNDNHNTYFWTAQGMPMAQPGLPRSLQLPWWARASMDRSPDGTAAPTLEGPLPRTSREWAWSRDGLLACATWNDRSWSDPAVHLWHKNGKRIAVLRGHRGGVESVDWSPDGTLLASGGGDSVRLWNADGSSGPVMTGHTDEVYPVAWSPDGRWLASAGSDATIRLWRRDGAAGPVFRGHQGGIHDLAWSPDSRKLASASWLDSTLRVWDVESQAVLWQALLVADNAPVTISPSGQVWHGDRALMADSLKYLSERPDGGIDVSQFAKFRRQAAQPLVRLFAERSDDATDRKAWNEAEAAFADALSFAPDGDSQLREQIIEMGHRLEPALTEAGESARAERVAQGVALLATSRVSPAPPKSE